MKFKKNKMTHYIHSPLTLSCLSYSTILPTTIRFSDQGGVCIKEEHIPFLLHERLEELSFGDSARFQTGIWKDFLAKLLALRKLRVLKLNNALPGTLTYKLVYRSPVSKTLLRLEFQFVFFETRTLGLLSQALAYNCIARELTLSFCVFKTNHHHSDWLWRLRNSTITRFKFSGQKFACDELFCFSRTLEYIVQSRRSRRDCLIVSTALDRSKCKGRFFLAALKSFIASMERMQQNVQTLHTIRICQQFHKKVQHYFRSLLNNTV